MWVFCDQTCGPHYSPWIGMHFLVQYLLYYIIFNRPIKTPSLEEDGAPWPLPKSVIAPRNTMSPWCWPVDGPQGLSIISRCNTTFLFIFGRCGLMYDNGEPPAPSRQEQGRQICLEYFHTSINKSNSCEFLRQQACLYVHMITWRKI